MVQNLRDNVNSIYDWDYKSTNIQQLHRHRVSGRQSNTKYLAYSCYSSGWISTVFIRGLEKRDERKRSQLDHLVTHCEIIITDFKQRNGYSIANDTLLVHLSKFPYWNEFKQHLASGHTNIYEPLQKAINTNKTLDQLENDDDYRVYTLRLKELFKGVELRTRTLGGACDECLQYHGKNTRKKYEKILHPETSTF